MSGLIGLTFSGFPPGYCYPGDPNTLFSDGLSYTDITFNAIGNVYYNYGNTVPGVDLRVYPWFKTLTDGTGPQGWYHWNGSLATPCWTQRHPVPNSTYDAYLRVIHKGTAASIDTKDWGEVGAVGPADGPFWEIDTDFAFRIPIGAGTSAGGTTLVAGDTGGEENHTLLTSEIPSHIHYVASDYAATSYGTKTPGFPITYASNIGGSINSYTLNFDTDPSRKATLGDSSTTGGGDEHNNMPPYYTVYYLKRTARIYYKIL